MAIIFGDFSNVTIWQKINLAISNTAIYKDCNVIIWRQLILANFLNSPISPNKSSPIINRFTEHVHVLCNLLFYVELCIDIVILWLDGSEYVHVLILWYYDWMALNIYMCMFLYINIYRYFNFSIVFFQKYIGAFYGAEKCVKYFNH